MTTKTTLLGVSHEAQIETPLFLEPFVEVVKGMIGSTSLKEDLPYPTLEQPNIFLDAASGKGKSLLLLLFKNVIYTVPSAIFIDEFTYIDVFNCILPEYRQHNKNLIVIEDLNQLVTRKKTTVDRLFGMLLSVLQPKGLNAAKDSSGNIQMIEPPLKLTMITACTPQILNQQYISWFNMGLIDRIPLIVTWEETEEQQDQITETYQKIMSLKKAKSPKLKPQKLWFKPQHITITEDLSEQLKSPAKKLNEQLHQKYQQRMKEWLERMHMKDADSFKCPEYEKPSYTRIFLKMVNLCRGYALTQNRKTKEVTQEDVDTMKLVLENYVNFNFNPLGITRDER